MYLMYLLVTPPECYSPILQGESGFFDSSFFYVWCFLAFLMGLYSSVVAFRYAYCKNHSANPYQLLFRRIMSMATLVVAVFPIGCLLLLITLSFLWGVRTAPECLFTANMSAVMYFELITVLCTPIAVPTICIFVYHYSRPDRYFTKFVQSKLIE